MVALRRLLPGLVVSLVVALGCTAPPPMTALAHFKKTQGDTPTPHGRIKMDTVQSINGNTLQYETENGQIFQVSFDKQNGQYRYHNARQVYP